MFDIGFWEILLIAIIGLVVLGPERLPVAIRTVRDWMNSIRSFSEGVKNELSEELRIQELHTNLKKAEQSGMKDLSPEVAASVKSLQEAAKMVTNPYLTAEKKDSSSEETEQLENNQIEKQDK
jgi:sec-independent protein translocase protein TatB